MNQQERTWFRDGYNECLDVRIYALKKLLAANNTSRLAIEELLKKWEKERQLYHWQAIQEESPGITREEYEAELNESMLQIRKHFFSNAGYLKPQLIRINGKHPSKYKKRSKAQIPLL